MPKSPEQEYYDEEETYSNSSPGSSLGSSPGSPNKERERQAQCIRNIANFSHIKSFHLMEKGDFNPEMLNLYIEEAAPKVKALFEKIEKLDKKDMATHGKHFKHMIFTDVKSSSYGAKIIASAFAARGFQLAFRVQGPGFSLKSDEELEETTGNNFGVLMSKTFFDRSMNIKFRKSMLELFNRRPENIKGDLLRFMILDQGFKEGIDLYDIKYVHLFEPLVIQADEKQAIGRGTRFCGQMGLAFHPQFGWPLYVFRYEVGIPDDLQRKFLGSKQMFDLFLKYSNLDMRKVVFAAELEKAAIGAAVDKSLTAAVHLFKVAIPPPALAGGAPKLKTGKPLPPSKIMRLKEMQEYVENRFFRFRYPPVKLENHCGKVGGATAAPTPEPEFIGVNPEPLYATPLQGGSATGNLVNFTPTQDFVRHFFQTTSAYKGMLFFHSVGTGKTCSAIATATTSFEKDGYTILWVTRHTLKSDIWKNMYGQVCSMVIQEKLKKGELKLPQKIGSPMRFVSENWMEPISYKQFSNMLLQKNKIYDEMVRRNGKEDPLRKTLVIIDEAHKVYSPTTAASEKPNTAILERMVHTSYEKSGNDSVRILLMTGTPYTEDGMEMIQLLNLLRPKEDQLPHTFEKFGDAYLDNNGYFTKQGLQDFQDDISGYVSYLNRSQDARNFAHPVLENVVVPLSKSHEKPEKKEKQYDENGKVIKEKKEKKETQPDPQKERIKELKADIRELAKQLKSLSKDVKSSYKARCKDVVVSTAEAALEKAKDAKEKGINKCKEIKPKDRKECKEGITEKYKIAVETAKEKKRDGLDKCKSPSEEDIMDIIDEEGQEIQQELDSLESELNEILEKVNGVKEKKKELTKAIHEARKSLKDKKDAYKNIMKEIKKERTKIKAIKDKEKKKQAQKALRESMGKHMKALKKEVLDLRNRMVSLMLDKKLILILEGKSKLGNVSQQTALEKRCKV